MRNSVIITACFAKTFLRIEDERAKARNSASGKAVSESLVLTHRLQIQHHDVAP